MPVRRVLIRDPEERFAPQALLCSDLTGDPEQIVTWFVRRWSVEVTFQETRAHLGVETQRQWSDKAIARTTPCLLALFSIVTLLTARRPVRECKARQAAWYPKAHFHRVGCAGQRATGALARAGFGNVTPPTSQNKTSLRSATVMGRCPLQPRVNGRRRAERPERKAAYHRPSISGVIENATRPPAGSSRSMTGNATRIVARQRNRTWRRTGLGEVNGRLIENISSFILAIRRACKLWCVTIHSARQWRESCRRWALPLATSS